MLAVQRRTKNKQKKKQFIEISAVFRENSWKQNLSVKGCPPKLKNIEVQSILKNCCTTIDDLYCDHSSVGQKLVFVNQKTLEASLLFFCSFWPLSASLRICQRTPLQKLIYVSLRTSNCQYTLFKFRNLCRKSSKVASSPPPGTESVWPQFPGNDSNAGSPARPQDFRLLRPTLTVLRPAADTLRELPAPP